MSTGRKGQSCHAAVSPAYLEGMVGLSGSHVSPQNGMREAPWGPVLTQQRGPSTTWWPAGTPGIFASLQDRSLADTVRQRVGWALAGHACPAASHTMCSYTCTPPMCLSQVSWSKGSRAETEAEVPGWGQRGMAPLLQACI